MTRLESPIKGWPFMINIDNVQQITHGTFKGLIIYRWTYNLVPNLEKAFTTRSN